MDGRARQRRGLSTRAGAAVVVLAGAQAAHAGPTDRVFDDLSVSTPILARGLMSADAYGVAQPAATSDCILIANPGSQFSNCSNHQDSSPSDIGYYFGFRAGPAGGTNVEVDLATANGGGGWGQNPLTHFAPGSGDGSVADIILQNNNAGSPYEYNGLVLAGSGPANDLAAIIMTGIGMQWRKGVSIESGVLTDGVRDTSNSWKGLYLSTPHDSGILVDPGTTLGAGLVVLPSDPVAGLSNSQFAWTPQNGTQTGTWELGPMRGNGALCGLCVQTPPAPWGGVGEVDFTAGGGLMASGAVGYGSAHGRGGLVVAESLVGSGKGSFALTPDGGAESASDNAVAGLGAILAADATATLSSALRSETIKAVVSCSGDGSEPTVFSVDAVLGGSPWRVMSQVERRLIGGAGSPGLTIKADSVSMAPVPTITSGSPTTCLASSTLMVDLLAH